MDVPGRKLGSNWFGSMSCFHLLVDGGLVGVK